MFYSIVGIGTLLTVCFAYMNLILYILFFFYHYFFFFEKNVLKYFFCTIFFFYTFIINKIFVSNIDCLLN